MIERTQFGTHTIWTEEETGFICFVQNGTFSEADAISVLEILAKHGETTAPGEPVLFLADYRTASDVTHGARKVLANAPLRGAPVFYGAFGASFAFRVAANLVFSAMMLISRSKITLQMEAEEAEARAWLNQQKLAYAARKNG
ncbi:MAG TPA: hypothetical protein VM580_31440 [Labilithrix sp.]|jgi:hypothetical protein|nr:hypothetical protein [Labilithrix sp.]